MRKKPEVEPGIVVVVTTFRKKGNGTTGKRATVHFISPQNVPQNRRIIEGPTFRDMYKKLVRTMRLPPGVQVNKSGRTFIPCDAPM